LFFPFVAT
jgi:hypothetical protein